MHNKSYALKLIQEKQNGLNGYLDENCFFNWLQEVIDY